MKVHNSWLFTLLFGWLIAVHKLASAAPMPQPNEIPVEAQGDINELRDWADGMLLRAILRVDRHDFNAFLERARAAGRRGHLLVWQALLLYIPDMGEHFTALNLIAYDAHNEHLLLSTVQPGQTFAQTLPSVLQGLNDQIASLQQFNLQNHLAPLQNLVQILTTTPVPTASSVVDQLQEIEDAQLCPAIPDNVDSGASLSSMLFEEAVEETTQPTVASQQPITPQLLSFVLQAVIININNQGSAHRHGRNLLETADWLQMDYDGENFIFAVSMAEDYAPMKRFAKECVAKTSKCFPGINVTAGSADGSGNQVLISGTKSLYRAIDLFGCIWNGFNPQLADKPTIDGYETVIPDPAKTEAAPPPDIDKIAMKSAKQFGNDGVLLKAAGVTAAGLIAVAAAFPPAEAIAAPAAGIILAAAAVGELFGRRGNRLGRRLMEDGGQQRQNSNWNLTMIAAENDPSGQAFVIDAADPSIEQQLKQAGETCTRYILGLDKYANASVQSQPPSAIVISPLEIRDAFAIFFCIQSTSFADSYCTNVPQVDVSGWEQAGSQLVPSSAAGQFSKSFADTSSLLVVGNAFEQEVSIGMFFFSNLTETVKSAYKSRLVDYCVPVINCNQPGTGPDAPLALGTSPLVDKVNVDYHEIKIPLTNATMSTQKTFQLLNCLNIFEYLSLESGPHTFSFY